MFSGRAIYVIGSLQVLVVMSILVRSNAWDVLKMLDPSSLSTVGNYAIFL